MIHLLSIWVVLNFFCSLASLFYVFYCSKFSSIKLNLNQINYYSKTYLSLEFHYILYPFKMVIRCEVIAHLKRQTKKNI